MSESTPTKKEALKKAFSPNWTAYFFYGLAFISLGIGIVGSLKMYGADAAEKALQNGAINMVIYLILGLLVDYGLRMGKLKKFLEKELTKE